MNRKRILFVDDEPNVLEGLQNLLRRHRREWEMMFALGGEAALAELARGPVDVVVSDMRMPGIDGATLLRRVQEQYPQTARIVLSGHADRDAIVRTLQVAHQCLNKPCDPAELRLVIEQTCGLQSLLHHEGIRVLAGRLDKLPSVPHCYRQLADLITKSDTRLADVAGIVEQDPAMTAKILQLVNSAYFGSGQHITSVRRAVMYLGSELIHGLVMSTGVFDPLKETLLRHLSLDALQERSLLTARLARRFMADRQRGDEAFAAAIVHDIGQVILAMGFPDTYGDVLSAADHDGLPLCEAERAAFGVTHAEAGAYLLGVWGLPWTIVETVAHHHTPALASQQSRELVAAVHVADVLAHQWASANAADMRGIAGLHSLDELQLDDRLPAWTAIATEELRTLQGGDRCRPTHP